MDFSKMIHQLLTILIVVISISDVCYSQRKLPKHSVVSVDVKTAVHFDCPEEFGYYPHPDDCTQYYVCVFGGALLESCTGGLMYSQELQTCDWPRNVGCDGADIAAVATTPSSSRTKEEYTRTRYTPPPPPKPSALVISRGQPRQQQIYHDDEINLKQQQLYQESEEALPEAQEEESDRQQRFYRGQPSTIGQVQRDRDGLRQSNAIAYHTGQKEKIGVISFGIHQPQEHQSDLTEYLETLTNNRLTLTRRKKRQTGPSHNVGLPTSWSSIQTINRPSYSSFQTRQPTGPDTSYRGSNIQRHPSSRQTEYNNPPRTHHPSRYLDVSQYNPNYFTSNAQNQKNNYYYFQVEPKKTPPKAVVLDKPEKIKLKYIQPAAFKSSNNTYTEAFTKGFDGGRTSAHKTINFSLPEQQNDFEWKPSNDQSNGKLKASPFHLNNFQSTSAPFYDTRNVFNEFSTAKPLKQSKNTLSSLFFTSPSTNTPFTTKTVSFEPTTSPSTTASIAHFYKNNNSEPSTSVKVTEATKPPFYLENYTAKPKQNQSNIEAIKSFESNIKNHNNTSKKTMKYSSKYKEEVSSEKLVRKPSKQGISTATSTVSPRQSTTLTYPSSVSEKARRKSTTDTPTTRQPTRSRTRITSNTASARGKNRQVTKNRNNVNNNTTRVESTTSVPETISFTSRNSVTTSPYSASSYSPYEPEYDDKTKYEYNSYNEPQPSPAPVSYRSRTAAPTYQQNDVQSSKRTNVIQNDYIRGVYQEQSLPEYHDVSYDTEEEDHYTNRHSNRQPIRVDRKESNLIEDQPSPTKSKNRNAASHTSSTSRYSTKKPVKTPTPISYKQSTVASRASSNATNENSQVYPKQSNYLVPGKSTLYTFPTDPSSKNTQTDISSQSDSIEFVEIGEPIPSLPTNQPTRNRYITKKPPSKSTDQVSSTGTSAKQNNLDPKYTLNNSSYLTSPSTSSHIPPTTYSSGDESYALIDPTTYSPPKFQLRRTSSRSSLPFVRPKLTDNSRNTTPRSPKQASLRPIQFRESTRNYYSNRPSNAVKFVPKIAPLNPISINQELMTIDDESSFDNTSSTEPTRPKIDQKYFFVPRTSGVTTEAVEVEEGKPTEKPPTTPSADLVTTQKTVIENRPDNRTLNPDQKILEKLNRYKNSSLLNPDFVPQTKVFKGTVEVPPIKSLVSDSDPIKDEPDLPPIYKLKPFKQLTKTALNKTDSSFISSTPRVSRINPAFKFMMNSLRGTKGANAKCKESTSTQICSDLKLRTNNRGRGSGHYTAGNAITNDVTVNTVNVNRGTPPPRSRPTLKPSTSIVSKAQEFVDIYRFPPRRPDPIYPQPQPDKTAAKCRKDVCLLPDCNCGGKEIPGEIPSDQVPQIVLLTFDDSVNDLNKGLYQDLFEKGRVNPNGCPISATFYVSHEWTDYSQVQNLYSDGHEIASHTISHSFGEQFSQKKWTREIAGQREILSAYGGVHLEDVRGMRAPFLSVGGNKMFKMLYDSNFTYDSSMPIYENKPPSWPYTLDYKLFHDCMIPPCPTRSYPGVWEVPMVMWQDLNGGRCSMGDACSNPADAEGVHKMIMKNFQRHYTTNRAPFGLFYHAAWFTQPHHKEGFINFLDNILAMRDVWVITNWQAVQWVRDPTPTSRLGSFKPFQCDYADRPKRCNNPKVCNLWHKSGVRYMRTCQPCPDIYPWTGNSGIRSSRIDNDIED